MALLAEEVVEEWLNRKGFFTIRGIKLGVHEIDILALRPSPDGTNECRQVEVQVSSNPIGYVCKVPKGMREELGIGANSVKRRTEYQMQEAVKEWIANKFDHPKKIQLRKELFPGPWTRELVVNEVKFPEELDIFAKAQVTVHKLKSIVNDMDGNMIDGASGSDLLDLMRLLKASTKPKSIANEAL